jgi:hypothetical protein
MPHLRKIYLSEMLEWPLTPGVIAMRLLRRVGAFLYLGGIAVLTTLWFIGRFGLGLFRRKS